MAKLREPDLATRRDAAPSRLTAVRIALAVAVLTLGDCARLQRAAPPPPVSTPPPTPSATAAPQAKRETFEATAYSLHGRTASGRKSRPGIVAADPKVLPIGTRIRVEGAGAYSGEYTVGDTGRTVHGHEIDIFIANGSAARRFGRKKVEVEILPGGSGQPAK